MHDVRQWSKSLDPAISYAVKVLRDHGVETFESCEGGNGHAFTEPTIRFFGGKDEGFRALACALSHELPVAEIRRYWQVVDGEPQGPHWEMTFHSSELLVATQARAEDVGLIA